MWLSIQIPMMMVCQRRSATSLELRCECKGNEEAQGTRRMVEEEGDTKKDYIKHSGCGL